MLDWRGLAGSSLVNGAALVLALVAQPHGFARARPGTAAIEIRLERPRIVLMSSRRHRHRSGPIHAIEGESAIGAACPTSEVDRDAVPDFPIHGEGAPFEWLRPTWRSPAYCIRIHGGGHVAVAFLSGSSGDDLADAAILGEIRRLRFHPAERRGAPISAWHRLVVNQPDGGVDSDF